MKKLFSLLSVVWLSVIGIYAQTSDNVYSSSSYSDKNEKDNPYATIGLPGDNLNLYLVLNTFKQSSSVEDFEKRLNDPASRINNLDLNNDGTIDYLKATDYGKDDYHTVIIQDIISASETQDVAVIDIQKSNNNTAHIQIIGDESLYGKDYIIEPQAENAVQQQTQPTTIVNNNYYTAENPAPYVNVWGWPVVSYFFGSAYISWVSPWHWAYYPSWWVQRPRVVYHVYYGYHRDFGWNYYCRRNYFVNQPRYYSYYNSRRVISPTVQVNVTKNVYHNAPRGAGYNNTGNYKNNGGGGWNASKDGSQPNNTNIGQKPKWNKGNNGNNPNNGGNPKGNGNWNNSSTNTNTPSQPKPNGGGNNHWNSSGSQPKPNMNNGQGQPKNNGGYKGGGKGNGSGIKTGTKGK